jgi:NADH-quinone oxidoreductase subunit J
MSDPLPYLFTALGAVCLWLMLPAGDAPRRRSLIGFTGVLSLLGLVLFYGTAMATSAGKADLNSTDWLFCIFGGSALVSGAMLVTQERPVYAALWFVMVVLSVAGLLLLLQAQFVAAVLVVVYAGAILVTYLFVIMLAVRAGMPEYDTHAHRPLGACIAAFLLIAAFWTALPRGEYPAAPAPADPTATASAEPTQERIDAAVVGRHTRSLATRLFSRHVVALETAGVLLLVAMAGAIVMARRKAAAS